MFRRRDRASPGCALAYAVWLTATSSRRRFPFASRHDGSREGASLRALTLDDDLPKPTPRLRQCLRWDWDWDETEREFRRAIELNPGAASAAGYALFLSAMEFSRSPHGNESSVRNRRSRSWSAQDLAVSWT